MGDKLLVLVTGGNQGLGFYAIQQLSATNKYHILLGSRDYSKAENAIQQLSKDAQVDVIRENVEPIQIDMSSDDSIQEAAKKVESKYGYLDILMPNAGIAYVPNASSTTTREQYRQIYDTNVFGAAITVDAFLPLLQKSTAPGGKRIAFTSSGLSSLEWALETEKYNGANYGIYRSSKTAMNMVMVHYTRRLQDEGFVVCASDPGYCATNLNGYRGLKDPREGAKVLVRAATETKEKVHGHVIDAEGQQPW